MDNRPLIPWQLANGFITDVFIKLGVPKDDAALCADVLLESDRRGIESHGLNRFKPIYIDRIELGIQNPVTKIDILKETPATAVIDANNGMGMVASKYAVDIAIQKAKKCGIAMTVVKNSTHYGIAGYWASMATKNDMIGITGTNARPSVAPTFGTENMLGTNPLTIGCPTDEDFPFMIDCATSIIQRGKVEYYSRIEKDVPSGMVVGEDGSPMTNSTEVLSALTEGRAALAPLGGIGDTLAGYKGYGYSTVVEILSAALSAGNFMKALNGFDGDKRVPHRLGHFFIVADPDAFMGTESFKKTTGDILRALRASKKAPGQDRIYTAGEKEYLTWLERKDKGVPVSGSVQNELIGLRDKYGLTQYVFPFEKD